MPAHDTSFDRWLATLEQRHLADLRFSDVRRALQAVSTSYVERRDRLQRSSVFDGTGKRAAFAMFYGPLHYLVTQHVVTKLELGRPALQNLVDLGCGTGVASAAWATAFRRPPTLRGVDRNSWAVGEARRTWHDLKLRGKAVRGNALATPLPGADAGIVAGWFVNELDDGSRAQMLEALCGAVDRGARVLVLEPISHRISPWWKTWVAACKARGGRADVWRFPIKRPDLIERFDRAAGLNHRELTARTLVF